MGFHQMPHDLEEELDDVRDPDDAGAAAVPERASRKLTAHGSADSAEVVCGKRTGWMLMLDLRERVGEAV